MIEDIQEILLADSLFLETLNHLCHHNSYRRSGGKQFHKKICWAGKQDICTVKCFFGEVFNVACYEYGWVSGARLVKYQCARRNVNVFCVNPVCEVPFRYHGSFYKGSGKCRTHITKQIFGLRGR